LSSFLFSRTQSSAIKEKLDQRKSLVLKFAKENLSLLFEALINNKLEAILILNLFVLFALAFEIIS